MKGISKMMGAGFLLLFGFAQAYAQTDPLPSWNNGAAKKAIVEFVKSTTEKGSPQFVAPEARIATFDQRLDVSGAADVHAGDLLSRKSSGGGQGQAGLERRRTIQDRAIRQSRGDGEVHDDWKTIFSFDK